MDNCMRRDDFKRSKLGVVSSKIEHRSKIPEPISFLAGNQINPLISNEIIFIIGSFENSWLWQL